MSFQSTHLSFGLNKRSTKPTEFKSNNVFGDNDDSDNDSINSKGGRQGVNQRLLKEQEFMRERARLTALDSQINSQVYDYDGVYDAMQNIKTVQEKREMDKVKEEGKKSRYIGKLLKTAKIRNIENEMAYERMKAREQKAEDEVNGEDYRGKEKFLTKAYKKKLEERNAYKKEQDELEAKEQANDVTKRGISGMAGFYGNLMKKNVAMGFNVGDDVKDEKQALNADITNNNEIHTKISNNQPNAPIIHEQKVKVTDPKEDERKRALARAAQRAARAEKIAAARERYFIRHNITA